MRKMRIAYTYLRFQFLPYVICAVLFVCLLPLLVGTRNLEYGQSAQIVERIFSLVGILLLIPIFAPDRDGGTFAVIRSRKTNYLTILLSRLLVELVLIGLLLLGVLAMLQVGASQFDFGRFFFAGMATVIFVGGLGVLVYAVTDQIVVAFMIPILYYVACFGGGVKYFGQFYLFTLAAQNWSSKWWLLGAGVCFIIVGLLWKAYRKA